MALRKHASGLFRENARYSRSLANFAVQTLDRIGGLQLMPVFSREVKKFCRILQYQLEEVLRIFCQLLHTEVYA